MDTNQTKIYTAILISSLLIGTIIVYFVVSLIRHQKRNLELHRLNILSEITTLEKERARMAADLHDELGPILTSIKFNVSSIEVPDKEDDLLLKKSSGQIDDAINRIREIARDLMPATLTRKGLRDGLDDFISNLHLHLHIQFEYLLQSEVPQEKGIHIYRMIKEIIQNTIRHAAATKLLIRLEEEKNYIRIICEDNGNGFDYEKIIQSQKGIGLRNLKSRAELLGGKFDIYSVKGKGTQHTITIPLFK